MIYLPSNNSENYPYACTNVRLMYFSIPQEPVNVSQALVVLIARSTQQEHPMCGSWRMQGCVISVTGGAMRWQCLEPHSSSLTISSVNSLVLRWENVFVGLYNKLFFETLKNIISQNSQNFWKMVSKTYLLKQNLSIKTVNEFNSCVLNHIHILIFIYMK